MVNQLDGEMRMLVVVKPLKLSASHPGLWKHTTTTRQIGGADEKIPKIDRTHKKGVHIRWNHLFQPSCLIH